MLAYTFDDSLTSSYKSNQMKGNKNQKPPLKRYQIASAAAATAETAPHQKAHLFDGRGRREKKRRSER